MGVVTLWGRTLFVSEASSTSRRHSPAATRALASAPAAQPSTTGQKFSFSTCRCRQTERPRAAVAGNSSMSR